MGNLATSLWFFPAISKFIHSVRGINFNDVSSVFISRGVVLDNRYPELITICEDVWLTQNVVVSSHSYCSRLQHTMYELHEHVAPVHIEKGVFVGTGSIILPGVTLGEACYIGAGSVVTKSISAGMLAVGNPCREIRPLKL